MTSFARLLELRGPWGHTVLDLPPGVLEAARQTVPPAAFPSFVAALLSKCSNWAHRGPITLHDVITSTVLFDCPGISRDHLLAFERQVWPRHVTIAQLEQYSGISPWVPTPLSRMDPKLRQLVEAVFAQESEWVRVAVLQHLLDSCSGSKLVCAPRSIEVALTGEMPSRTIPDDPRLHQLLRQLHAEVHAELRRQGKEVKRHTVSALRWSPKVKQLARHTSLHHHASVGFRALRGPGCAVSVDMQEQYGLSLPLEPWPLAMQGFHATDDLGQGFSSLVRGAGAGAGTLVALHPLKRKYDATAAGEAAAV
ncbi:hypothetical protein ABPG77_010299 [Micractinium sp. CCAP 211/92]